MWTTSVVNRIYIFGLMEIKPLSNLLTDHTNIVHSFGRNVHSSLNSKDRKNPRPAFEKQHNGDLHIDGSKTDYGVESGVYEIRPKLNLVANLGDPCIIFQLKKFSQQSLIISNHSAVKIQSKLVPACLNVLKNIAPNQDQILSLGRKQHNLQTYATQHLHMLHGTA